MRTVRRRRWRLPGNTGLETEDSSTDESSEEDEGEGWGRVERRNRNKEKKRRSKEKRKRKKEETTRKAQRMVGLGPISDSDIERQMRKTRDYEEAKIWAVKEHLAVNYRYNQEELDRLEIVETRRSNKDDKVVYIAMRRRTDIRDIYTRREECRNDKTVVKNYIPPQYFERFMALNRLCSRRRSEDSSLKTQVRFGERDLEVLVKTKGEDTPYRVVDLEAFADNEEIPEYDHNIKWRRQEDRMPRRRVASNQGADRHAAGKDGIERPVTGKRTGEKTAVNSLIRQNSNSEKEALPNKKLRKQEQDMFEDEEEDAGSLEETL